ncbi:MAG: amidohydrolase family protein [Proteobacteria bacterium]|nr:amidohydrolase family protein [Pseudomonadota bacterium]MDA1308220.1 amidohydrolase family protein [Pseudomonadota bacterium]
MLIADAQVHVWGVHTPERPWPADGFGREHTADPLTAEKLLAQMDAAGVERAVIVPPSWEGDRNDLALAAAAAHPGRLAIMGRLAIEDPATGVLLGAWREQPGMLGARITFLTPPQRQWLVDGTVDWFWPAVEKAGIPLMVLPPDQLPAIDRVAERHPGLRLVIDHLAMTSSRRDAEAFADLDTLLTLAQRPNVAVKASALPCYSTEAYPFPGLHRHIERVVDAFGPERVFWGTDLSRLSCSYREAITLFTEELAFLSETDKALIMGRGLCDWLGWKSD